MAQGKYEVGHGKPPKASQFKKGQSGNPGGKRKRRESDSEILVRLLDSRGSVVKDGETIEGTVRELMFINLVQQAANGCLKALKQLSYMLKDDSPPESNPDKPALGAVRLQNVISLHLEANDPGPGGIPYFEANDGETVRFDTVTLDDPSGVGPGSTFWVLPARAEEILGLTYDPAKTDQLIPVKYEISD